jgi:flagellar biosynthesis anti-sigma factor FlgM
MVELQEHELQEQSKWRKQVMRIDSNAGAQSLSESQSATSSASGKAGSPGFAAPASPLGEDQTQFSGVHVQLQAMVGQALQLPEVRAERVQTLREALASGQYQPSPQEIAGGLLSDFVR